MTQHVYVEIGESPQALVHRYGGAVDVNDKNFGLNFYTMDWPTDNPITVVIRNGNSNLQIDAVLMINGAFDRGYPDEGISSYSVSSELVSQPTVRHDQARLKFYEMLSRIQKAGWQRYLDDEEPRLKGVESIHRLLQTGISMTTLDPGYVPTFEEWMTLKERSSWQFYKDGVYMDVRMSRDSKHMDPSLPGAYFVSISLESYVSKWRTLFQEADRPRWRELLREEKQNAAAERAKMERQLQAEGYHVDTSYRNPDEAFDPDAKPASDPVGSDQLQSSAPQPLSSFKERFGRWIRGG